MILNEIHVLQVCFYQFTNFVFETNTLYVNKDPRDKSKNRVHLFFWLIRANSLNSVSASLFSRDEMTAYYQCQSQYNCTFASENKGLWYFSFVALGIRRRKVLISCMYFSSFSIWRRNFWFFRFLFSKQRRWFLWKISTDYVQFPFWIKAFTQLFETALKIDSHLEKCTCILFACSSEMNHDMKQLGANVFSLVLLKIWIFIWK